jgi:TNF receptor-associated protein 1
VQTGPVLNKLRAAITARCVRFFEKNMEDDAIKYQQFYDMFGVHFKEAIISHQDPNANTDIGKLLLFDSSSCRPGVKTSLRDYVKRMQTEQKSIYYVHVANRQMAETNPFYEAFRHTNMEVLFVSDLVDEMVLFHLNTFSDRPIVSAENWFKSQKKVENVEDETEYKDLCSFVAASLGPKRIEAVTLTSSSIESPCMITTAENESIMRTYGAMNNEMSEEHKIMLMRPKLLLNPKHPIIRRLNNMRRKEQPLADALVEQMWVNAMTQAGLMHDARSRVNHLNHLLTALVERSSTESGILTPELPAEKKIIT